ncbi:MAG: histidine kinase [Methylotenera sp.]|uniref:histidine kinase n=1 Tax=Methylotenera sp. TaxID=2051956 RepID=UPI00271CA0DE|nr:histidine kinase [Methylotenera sp.]MDO9150882.1 histidine kinase [Methylotenera sp.]
MKINEFWKMRKDSQRDAVATAVVIALIYVLILWVNLAETLTNWFAQYEDLQLDEIPFLLLLIALGMAWFSRRRMVELNKEIHLRALAEEKIMQLLVQNKALTRHVLRIQEVERLHLARDLHDDIGQYLLAIRLDASALNLSKKDQNLHASTSLYAKRILANADHIQAMTRALMRRLRPAPTSSQDCTEAISILIKEWHEQQPNIHLDINVEACSSLFTEQINITIYRFIQEALTNISKHADALNVSISLKSISNERGQLLCIEIIDDGVGFKAEETSHGMGIIGMRERIDALNGTFIAKNNISKGVTISAQIPI